MAAVYFLRCDTPTEANDLRVSSGAAAGFLLPGDAAGAAATAAAAGALAPLLPTTTRVGAATPSALTESTALPATDADTATLGLTDGDDNDALTFLPAGAGAGAGAGASSSSYTRESAKRRAMDGKGKRSARDAA